MPCAAMRVPARWVPARQWMNTVVPRKMAFEVIWYNVAHSLFIVQFPRQWEAASPGGMTATVPIKGRDVHCEIGNEADPERLHAIDIIGGN